MLRACSTIVRRWFHLDGRYDSPFANRARWFFFVFWVVWSSIALAVSILASDPLLLLLGVVTSAALVVGYRALFAAVSKANNWKRLE